MVTASLAPVCRAPVSPTPPRRLAGLLYLASKRPLGKTIMASRRPIGLASGEEAHVMDRRNLIFGMISSSCFGICRADAWPLITRQESQREHAAPHIQTAPAAPRSGTPTIRIEEPDLTRPVRLPANIRIRFHASADARIEVNTLRVRYGFLGIDITRRILAHARPNPSGVFVEDAELPRGRHRVTIQIADTMGRSASQSFDFNVI
jgi:hypothetical protein